MTSTTTTGGTGPGTLIVPADQIGTNQAAAAKPVPRKRAATPAPIIATEGVSSVFEALRGKIYNYQYDVELHVGCLVGGTPTDKNVAEGWIRTKMGATSEEQVAAEVAKVMEERGVTGEEAVKTIARNRSLSGFKRDFTTPIARMVQERAVTEGVYVLDEDGETKIHRQFTPEEAERTFGEMFIEGRQVKAMLKESAMIAVGADRIKPKGWGTTRKGMLGFLVEHLFVKEDKILLGVTDADEVAQSFVHTWRGSGIKLEERVRDAVVGFTLMCDFDFEEASKDFWPHLFVTGEENGLGASRSQGFGKFKVTRFKRIDIK